MPTYHLISPAQATQQQAAGALLIDVRTPAEFAAGHLLGATNIPLNTLSAQISRFAAPNRPLLLYCSSGQRSRSAALILMRLGYRRLYVIQ